MLRKRKGREVVEHHLRSGIGFLGTKNVFFDNFRNSVEPDPHHQRHDQ